MMLFHRRFSRGFHNALPLAAFAAAAIALVPQQAARAQVRFGNIVNKKFATVSSGPQSVLLVDVPSSASATDEAKIISAAANREWLAKSAAMQTQMSALQKAGVLKPGGAIPMSTVIAVRKNGRLVLPTLKKSAGRSFPGGDITFSYTGFNDTDTAFLKAFIDVAYPRIVAVYGKPAQSGNVEIVNTGFYEESTIPDVQRLYKFGGYDATNNRILLPRFVSNQTYGNAILLNMIHAFHGPAVFQYDAWEQGFARAAASVVSRDPVFGFTDGDGNNLYSLLKFYDVLNQPALSNNTFYPPSQAGLPLEGQTTIAKMTFPRVGMSGAAWLKVYIENPNFFRDFNAAYYAAIDQTATPSLAGNVPQLRAMAATLLPNGVEGQPWDTWFQSQYILDSSVSAGTKLYAFAIPNPIDETNKQADSITLVNYRTLPNGEETLLNGTAYATYFDATNARLNLGAAAEQASISNGEGFITTQSFFTAGTDATRITADFNVGNATARTYLPLGFQGDFQAVVVGPNNKGNVTVTQTTVSPVTTYTKSATLGNAAFGVGLGTKANDLAKTVVTVTDGTNVQTFRINTGDGLYYAVLKTGLSGSGIVTLTKSFPYGDIPQLVSFPLRPQQTPIDAALGLSAADFLLSYWDSSRPAYETLLPGSSTVAPITPGRGYWLKIAPVSVAPNTTVTLTGTPPATDTDFTIPCPFGWNLVGSPFSGSIDISRVLVQQAQNEPVSWDQAVTSNLVSANPYGFDPSTGYQTVSGFDGTNWKGYWVRVLIPTGVTLLLPGPDSVTTRAARVPTRAASAVNSAGRPDWTVRLQLRSSADGVPFGGMASAQIGGTRQKKTRAWDSRFDRELPPAIVPSVGLGIVHKDWGASSGGRYVADFRPTPAGSTGMRETWDMEAVTPRSGTMTLTWDGLGTLGRTTRLTLIDKTANTQVNLRNRSSYTWSGEAGTTRALQIVAEPALTNPLSITNVQMTRTRATGVNGGAMVIGYGLTSDAEVTIDITQFGGRLVRRLSSGRAQTTGQQTMHWDGRAENGAALPAGTYQLSITARDTNTSQTAQQTRPVTLTR